jgi:hypothetical protein
VIVVVGAAALQPDPVGGGRAVGLAPEIAAAAAATGSVVEILTGAGEDGAGEELLLALGRRGVGHLAVLRDPARPTALAPTRDEPQGAEDDDVAPALLAEAEAALSRNPAEGAPAPPGGPGLEPADVALGLRYLRDFSVLVAVEPLAGGAASVIADAAAFAAAPLVVVAVPGASLAAAYGAATVMEAPAADPDGAFAALVGRYAAALDRGVAPAEAFAAVTAEGGWELADS